jgi:hypothetical protein
VPATESVAKNLLRATRKNRAARAARPVCTQFPVPGVGQPMHSTGRESNENQVAVLATASVASSAYADIGMQEHMMLRSP